VVVGEVVGWSRGRGLDTTRRRRRLRAPFVSAVVITTLVGAGIASMWFDRRPTAVDGSGVFRLCGWAPSQNCVVDGDTILYGGVKIRLSDIDAPETVSALLWGSAPSSAFLS
jgi:endonuclease YncB( thermonuclease family)